jgi:hypothetical protein
MTFSEVVSEILHYSGQGSGGEFETHVKALVNERYLGILEEFEVPHEERVFTLTSVVGQSRYGLPLYVREVLNIEDPTTPRFIYESNARAFDKQNAGTTDSGTPLYAFPTGVRGVQAIPSTAATLTVVSDSAADTGANYKVRITGFNSAGVLVSELVTMAGLTPVATANSYSASLGVERVVKAPGSGYSFAGNVTVKDNAGNVIATIPLAWRSPSYQWIQFHPIPDAAITYNIRAAMRKPPLVNAEDWLEFPEEFHMMAVFGVTRDLLGKMGMAALANQHRASYKELAAELAKSCYKSTAGFFTFSDVMGSSGLRNRPHRPLIKGVDFGLV